MLSAFLLSAALSVAQAPASANQASMPAAAPGVVNSTIPSLKTKNDGAQDGSIILMMADSPAPNQPAAAMPAAPANGNGNGNGAPAEKSDNIGQGFFHTFFKTYCDEFKKKGDGTPEEEQPRRAPPDPWESPPFPTHSYQGYPLIGVPAEDPDSYPLMKAIQSTDGCVANFLKDEKINIYGWVTVSGNFSDDKKSNSPTSYWLKPNNLEMDQTVLRFERNLDSVQTDHWDWGFRSSFLYGIDYRYMSADGWFQDQFVKNNRLYGFDPTEQYVDIYCPHFLDGVILRVGRWIACPDIETQFSPDNYLGSHSILFTYDTYTQTGFMFTFQLNKYWMYQIGMNAGNDQAPWATGATGCFYTALRWVSKDNRNSIYTVINQLDDAEFNHFNVNNEPAGHDNFNYWVTTWEHVFNEKWHTATEDYIMWQRNAVVGGTPSVGPIQSFGGGGGSGAPIPGITYTYGVLNYTEYKVGKQDYICFRNEWWKDDKGMRSGFPGVYTSNTIGWSHNFNALFQVRPEFGYYRNWTEPAFDLGTRNGAWIAGFDATLRF